MRNIDQARFKVKKNIHIVISDKVVAGRPRESKLRLGEQ